MPPLQMQPLLLLSLELAPLVSSPLLGLCVLYHCVVRTRPHLICMAGKLNIKPQSTSTFCTRAHAHAQGAADAVAFSDERSLERTISHLARTRTLKQHAPHTYAQTAEYADKAEAHMLSLYSVSDFVHNQVRTRVSTLTNQLIN